MERPKKVTKLACVSEKERIKSVVKGFAIAGSIKNRNIN
ncbi:hypothetical protein BQ1740_3868 [Bacillus subtilis]|nr:hypothetical protein BQ1740_3868 [Bacillus subtilis]